MSRVRAPTWFDAAWYTSKCPTTVWSDSQPFDDYITRGIALACTTSAAHELRVAQELDPLRRPTLWAGPGDSLQQEIEEALPGWLATAGDSIAVRRSFAAGARSALLPVALVQAACADAIEAGASQVFYLSREGHFLREVHEVITTILGTTDVRSRTLAVSRVSTFGPSLDELTPTALRRLWSQYPVQTPRSLLESLGADATMLRSALGALAVGPEQPLAFATDPTLATEILDAISPQIWPHVGASRRLLRGYLAQQEMSEEGVHVVCDLGWRGTIQDNLAAVLPAATFVGRYLGLFEYLNPQPPNGHKNAVAFDANRGDDHTYASPQGAIEEPWTPDRPSTVGYRMARDGLVCPVDDPRRVPVHPGNRWFQAGALRAAPLAARFVRSATPAATHEACVSMLRAYFTDPLDGVADIWFGATHDDHFGAGNVNPYRFPQPNLEIVESIGRGIVAAEMMDTRWPQGYRRWWPVQVALLAEPAKGAR